jgi:hypothetical protein
MTWVAAEVAALVALLTGCDTGEGLSTIDDKLLAKDNGGGGILNYGHGNNNGGGFDPRRLGTLRAPSVATASASARTARATV